MTVSTGLGKRFPLVREAGPWSTRDPSARRHRPFRRTGGRARPQMLGVQ